MLAPSPPSSRGTAMPSRRSARGRVAVDRLGVFGGNRGHPLDTRRQIAGVGGVGGAQIARRGENAARGVTCRLNVLIDL
jgi:hypothetical protein